MDLDTTIKGRRSIRKYLKKDIPDPIIMELVDLARHAPSSMNGQPCSFIIIRNQDTRDKLAAIKDKYCPAGKQQFKATMLRDAPVVIAVCADRDNSHDRGIENGILATTHLMLAAHSRGLGCVYMSAYAASEPQLATRIREVLDIPPHVDPVTLLPLGYADETPREKHLKPLKDLVFHEKHR